MDRQKGLASILIVLILAAATFGYLIYSGKINLPQKQVACTEESRICPDGSSVGRTGPKCEFTACPSPKADASPAPTGAGETANWKTYAIPNILTFKYPPSYVIRNSMPGVVIIADKEANFGPAQTSILIDTRMTGVHSDYNKTVSLIEGKIEQLTNGVKTTHVADVNLNNVNQTFRYTNIYYKYKEGAIVVIYGDDQVGSRRYDQIISTFKFTD